MSGKPVGTPRNSGEAKKRSRKIRVCPFCRQPTLRAADSISGWMTAEILKCDKCGYRGPIFIEVDPEELEKMRETLQTGTEESEIED